MLWCLIWFLFYFSPLKMFQFHLQQRKQRNASARGRERERKPWITEWFEYISVARRKLYKVAQTFYCGMCKKYASEKVTKCIVNSNCKLQLQKAQCTYSKSEQSQRITASKKTLKLELFWINTLTYTFEQCYQSGVVVIALFLENFHSDLPTPLILIA